jgi:hypothetical protein
MMIEMHPILKIAPESLAIIRRGEQSAKWLEKDHNWAHWMRVGEALIEIRRLAMDEARTNRPFGRVYTTAHGRLLERFKWVTQRLKDPADRHKLVQCMDNLAAIEQWRAGFPPHERNRWNHPVTVWRRYQADQRAAEKSEQEEFNKPETIAQKLAAAQRLIGMLNARIKELKEELAEFRSSEEAPNEPAEGGCA